MRALGLILRSARENQGRTVQQVAAATGIPGATISNLEAGRIPEPVVLTVCQLAEHYGIGNDATERERFLSAVLGEKAPRV